MTGVPLLEVVRLACKRYNLANARPGKEQADRHRWAVEWGTDELMRRNPGLTYEEALFLISSEIGP